MSAYLILTQTVTDPDRYLNEYVPAVMPFLGKYGAQVIVGEFAAEPLEGSPPESVVVVRFPSKDAIRNFLTDPTYQPVKDIRIAITKNANAVMADEFAMPSG